MRYLLLLIVLFFITETLSAQYITENGEVDRELMIPELRDLHKVVKNKTNLLKRY